MPRGGSSRERRVETDSHQNPNTMGCSPKNSTLTKTLNVSPCRRQSSRLRALNAVYQAEDAISSELQQASGDSSHHFFTQTKAESIESTDDPSITETLKDLRRRCKSKKRKALNLADSSTSDQSHALVKPKEEEPDLEEPLIFLKLKSSNKSRGRKEKRLSHHSESVLSVEGITALACYPSFNRKEDFSLMPNYRSLTAEEVAFIDESNSTPESINENSEVISDNDQIHVGSPELVYTIKSEIVETCNTVSSNSVISGNCSALGELSHKICEESVDDQSYSASKILPPCVISYQETGRHNYSPSAGSQMGASFPVDASKSVNEVKSEAVEAGSLETISAGHISATSDLDCIGDLNNPGSSCSKVQERMDEECGKEPLEETDKDVNPPRSNEEPLDCCVNQVSLEFMETDNCTSLPERSIEQYEDKIELDSAERSCHKFSPSKTETQTPCAYNSQLVSATTNLGTDVCGEDRNLNSKLGEVIHQGVMTQLDNLAVADCQECTADNNSTEFHTAKQFENNDDEILVPDIPICNREKNASGFSEEVGSLGSLVFKALCGDARRNSNEGHFDSHIDKSSLLGIYYPCLPWYSGTSCDSVEDSHAADESSPGTESFHYSTLDQNSSLGEKANTSEVDEAELVEEPDCHSPQVSPSDSSAVNNVKDSSSESSEKVQPSAENMLSSPVEMPTSRSPEMSYLVKEEGSNMENELKLSPIKLLSNRKEFSPTSQEKLRWALHVNKSDDMIKTADHEENEVMLSSERKRAKNRRNRSFQLLSKGTLRSQDPSDGNCSCSNSTFIHIQAQKAVTFSQRQMQDIENIATKLLNGLTSMKNIMVENTGSDELRSDEIRMAIKNASNLEATTRKWMSMMAKDCNRFCKIMNVTENKGASPTAVRKQRKKITFADEAGGSLCHVKVFDQLPASL
ncbi:uncharacterized protein LOC109819598 isoform X2 [Asparagus officinalis]|uniref:uncharacterized protein LOC109819598 isoform X2 n=1 Tax=Asparagus officinalis TaxID=4686 RepID=UPI00098DEBEB|nr:uncharacterized protein LOC109819598 isoform X2 [Asparagus officinalis]